MPARRTSGLVHGTGSESTQSILNTPGPCLYRDTQRRYPSGTRSPAIATKARGVVSSRTAGTPSNSRRSVTSCPVTSSPPCSSRAVTIASASACEPPSTRGQPTWWASMPSIIPRLAVSGRARSSIPCAAAPAISACASGVSKKRWASQRTFGSPVSAKRVTCGTLLVGGRRNCDVRKKSTTSVPCSTRGSNSRRYAAPSGPRPGGGFVDRAQGHRRASAVERVGVTDLRVHEPHPAAGQVELAEERCGGRHRLHGGADVVTKAGTGQLLGAQTAAGPIGPLDHLDAQPGRG